MSEAGAEGLVAELQARAESYRLGGPSSEHTAALLDRAAIVISSTSAALEDAKRIFAEQVTRAENQWKSWEARAETAEAALEAQGRALAEAGAENERKTRDIEVKARILSRMAKAITGIERERDEALEALRPFALVAEHDIGSDETDADIFQQPGHYHRAPRITVGDMRRARSVLENGPARLADANSKSPSSQDQEIAGPEVNHD